MPPEGTDPDTGGGGGGPDPTDIPTDIPGDADDALNNFAELAYTAMGAALNMYEACKKIEKGTELAQVTLILSRKLKEMNEAVFDLGLALNVKSTNRSVTTSRADLTTTGALYQLLEFLETAGIIQNNSTA